MQLHRACSIPVVYSGSEENTCRIYFWQTTCQSGQSRSSQAGIQTLENRCKNIFFIHLPQTHLHMYINKHRLFGCRFWLEENMQLLWIKKQWPFYFSLSLPLKVDEKRYHGFWCMCVACRAQLLHTCRLRAGTLKSSSNIDLLSKQLWMNVCHVNHADSVQRFEWVRWVYMSSVSRSLHSNSYF